MDKRPEPHRSAVLGGTQTRSSMTIRCVVRGTCRSAPPVLRDRAGGGGSPRLLRAADVARWSYR